MHLFLVLAAALLGGAGTQAAVGGAPEAVEKAWQSGAPPPREVVLREGSQALIECNVTGVYEVFGWYSPTGQLLEEHGGAEARWRVEANGVLNFSEVSFSDRGRYTCLASRLPPAGGGVARYAVRLRVAYTHSGLGLFYVGVCLVTFALTVAFNAARLCMVSGHLKETEDAINDFFRSEGLEKLQKAFEVAKRIPIITSAKTAELAKTTQFKTLELVRHVEELARSVPLPPLITGCRQGAEGGPRPTRVSAQEASRSLLTEPAHGALLTGAGEPGGDSFHVQVSIHLDSPGGAEPENQEGSRNSVASKSNA